jgi:hypothetical protein
VRLRFGYPKAILIEPRGPNQNNSIGGKNSVQTYKLSYFSKRMSTQRSWYDRRTDSPCQNGIIAKEVITGIALRVPMRFGPSSVTCPDLSRFSYLSERPREL